MIRTGGITQLLTAVRLQIHGSDLWSSDMCGCIPVSLGVCGQRAAEWAVSLHFELSTWTPTAGERIHASAVCDNFWHMTVPDWSVAESDLHYHEQNRERLSSLLTVPPAAQPCVTDSLVRLDDVSFLKNILYLSGSPLAVPETQLLLLETTFRQKTYI